jgi:hypothetical protein
MTARDLSDHLASLLRRERDAMADFLLALADSDAKSLWRELGHTSLFSYLHRELGLSAGSAQLRKTAVGLIQGFREVEAALRQGHLCLSSVCELAKVLTPENVADVLPRFFGLSSREAALVAVSIRPVEDPARREVVTAVRPAAAPSAVEAPLGDQLRPPASEEDLFHAHETPLLTHAPAGPPAAPARPSRAWSRWMPSPFDTT